MRDLYTKKKLLILFVAFSLVVLAAISTLLVIPGAHASSPKAGIDAPGTPKFIEMHGKTICAEGQEAACARVSAPLAHTASAATDTVESIPFWSSVFAANGSLFPYQMVGTDPSAGSATTHIRTEIIPLKLQFSNGTLDGSNQVLPTINSPIFSSAKFSSGTTQYGDAMQRAEFWKYVSTKSPDYHALLDYPQVYPTVTLTVPASSGKIVKGKNTGASIGEADVNWFDTQLQSLLTSLNLSDKTLPIFLDYNTFLYQGDPSQCCILGYHNAIPSTNADGKTTIATYAFAAYSDPGLFGNLPIEDVHSLSHEIAEWYNDPFTDNTAPNWQSPLSPQYGCNNALEVGDPLVGIAIPGYGAYHPQDMAFFSWFAQQKPSLGIDGKYTYLGTFNTVAPSCSTGAGGGAGKGK